MKKNKFKSLVAIAAALICVGCVAELKEVAPAYNPEITDGEVKSVEFVIPGFVEEDGGGIQTKTTLTSSGFVWAEKDTVGIFPFKGNQIYYEMSSGAGSSSAEFDGGGWALKDEHLYSSYYPLQGNFYLDRKAISVNYDTEVTQVGNNNSDHLGANAFMFAPETKLSNGKVTFKFWQLGSVLKPRVTLPAGTYTKLVLSTDEPIFVVSGKYDLTTGVDATSSTATYPEFVPVIVPETGGLTNKLTINLEDVTFSAETELIAYIMAAPVDVSNIPITVTIYCGDSPKYMYEFMRTSSFVAQTNHNIRPNEKGLMSAANTSESANAAFAAGETSLSLVNVTDNASLDLILPETSDPVSIIMAADEGKCAMSVSYPSGTTVPAELNIEVSDGSDLVINTPQSTVTLDGERTYNSVRASTASNTLIIDEDVTIGTLYLEKGNVQVYGEIMALNTDDLEEGETPTVYVYGNIQGQIDDDDVTVVIPASKITIAETEKELKEGESVQLSASLVPANATSPIVWSTSDASVATVSESGLVTAVGIGDCTISATINGLDPATCSVTVISDDPAKQPFTITSAGSTTVAIEKVGSPSDISLEYKKGNAGWVSYTIGTAIALGDGESLQFRAGEGGNDSFSSGSSAYYKVSASGTGTVAAAGNIMSLVDRTLQTTSVSESEFTGMFYQCSKLTDVSQLLLPATTLARSCYDSMFLGCSSLTAAPVLPATAMAESCYQAMFYGCRSLSVAPALPATRLADFCFRSMFLGCTSLTTAPKLPLTALAMGCYMNMFQGCTSLAIAPELPVTTLAHACYQFMFSGCTSLTTAPVLPATTLVSGCYNYMFSGCTSLTTAPVLPATTLVSSCYEYMFSGCSKLNYVKALFVSEPSQFYTNNWLDGVASTGTFVMSKDAYWDVSGSYGIPYDWTVEIDGEGPILSEPIVKNLPDFGNYPFVCGSPMSKITLEQFTSNVLEPLNMDYDSFSNKYTWDGKTYVEENGQMVEDYEYGYITYNPDLYANELFSWSTDFQKIGAGKSQTVYTLFTSRTSDLYLGFSASTAEAASFYFGTNKIANEWHSDIDYEAANTAHINVLVPSATTDDVTDFSVDLTHLYEGNEPSFVLADDADIIYEYMNLNPQATFSFSSDQPIIGGYPLVTSTSGDKLYAGFVSNSNLLASIDGSVITFADTDIAMELLNRWSYSESYQPNMFYANITVKTTYGTCEIPAGEDYFHVRFMRPIDIYFDSPDVAEESSVGGTNVKMAKFIAGIVDWNMQKLIVDELDSNGKPTGYMTENVVKGVNMYQYYQFDSLVVDLENAERDNWSINDSYRRGLLTDVSPDAQLKLGTVDANDIFTEGSGNTIDISEFTNLKTAAINYMNDRASVENFNIFIPVKIYYSWGVLDAELEINVMPTYLTYGY